MLAQRSMPILTLPTFRLVYASSSSPSSQTDPPSTERRSTQTDSTRESSPRGFRRPHVNVGWLRGPWLPRIDSSPGSKVSPVDALIVAGGLVAVGLLALLDLAVILGWRP